MQLLLKRGTSVDDAVLPAEYEFLRVTIRDNTAILGLARVDPHPEGQIAHWSNALGEVLQIQEGRIVAAIGLPTEWRGVMLPKLPTWPDIAALNAPYRWTRVRDVMPGYRFNIRDELAVRAIAPPQKSGLRAVDPQTLTWFEEQFDRSTVAQLGTALSPGTSLPPARYAVRMSTQTVLYSEQCLAPDLCLVWQRWSAELQQANKKPALSAKQ